jgi:hypothetical protein
MIHCLLSANASPPVGLLFASWLLCHPCCCAATTSHPLDTPPPPLVLLTQCLRPRDKPSPLVCWRLSSRLPLFCQLVLTYHLVASPPQVSIPDPRLHSHRLVVASHLVALLPPTVLLSTPPPLDALVTHLPFASCLPQLVACVFDLACPISWIMAICQGYAQIYLYATRGGGCISDMSICRKMQNRVNLGLKRRIFMSKTHMSLCFYVFGNAPIMGPRGTSSLCPPMSAPWSHSFA